MRLILPNSDLEGGKKGQSMAELAIFGSILLMVLSFFLRYAMNLNNNLQLKMEVYKTALTKAKVGTDLDQTYVYKDYSMAEPQDAFGFAPRQVNSAGDHVTWMDNKTKWTPPPGINYTFESGKGDMRVSETFSTAGNVSYSVSSIQMTYPFWPDPVLITKLKAYKEVDRDGQLKLLVDGLAHGECSDSYCPTDIVSSGDVDHDESDETILAADGDGSVQVQVWDYQEGQIDTAKMDPWEDPAGYQGAHLPKLLVQRNDRLYVADSSGATDSRSELNEITQNDYKIQLNKGASRHVSLVTTEDSVWSIYGSK